MRFATLCSGIGAPELAWTRLGWGLEFASEIDAFPAAVHAHHFPGCPNFGDMTAWESWGIEPRSVDVICAGTPCQSFSIAGLRAGLDDDRGNLAREFSRIVGHLRPDWFVWENVPGALSSNGGRDFSSIIGAMVQFGYSVCWRVLDAQFFGVPQRRRRVFIVGHLGDWRRSCAVLFERTSMSRNTPARGRTAEDHPSTNSARTAQPLRVANCLTSRMYKGINTTLDEGQTPIVANARQDPITSTVVQPLDTEPTSNAVLGGEVIRILTPREAERAQGFPDDYTRIAWDGRPARRCPDPPRYRAIGNSMAVPVLAWIGRRIQMVENIP